MAVASAELVVQAKTSAPMPVIIAPNTAPPPTFCAFDVLSMSSHATPAGRIGTRLLPHSLRTTSLATEVKIQHRDIKTKLTRLAELACLFRLIFTLGMEPSLDRDAENQPRKTIRYWFRSLFVASLLDVNFLLRLTISR